MVPKSLVARSRIKAGKRSAVTLVELLVAVSILGILVALLLPGMKSALRGADAARCLQQLKGLAVLAAEWSAENDGRILPSCTADGEGWPQILQAYSGKTLIRCPVFQRKYRLGDYPATGYGRNSFLNGSDVVGGWNDWNGNGRVTQIGQPSRTVAFYENENIVAGDAFGGYNRDGGGLHYYYLYPAHGASFNVSFFDGHAERLPFNASGPYGGNASGDYPDLIWKPY